MADQVNLALFVLRVATGVMIALHGYAKIFKGGKLAGTAGWFESMGMKPGWLHARLAAGTEIGTGVLLMVGLLTPLAAAGLLSVMIVAWITAHRNNGFYIYNAGQGWEYVGYIAAMCVVIGTLGAGEWSIDDAADLHFDGWAGFWTTLIVGIAGAAGLLGVFWRPPKKA